MEQAEALLAATVDHAHEIISNVARAFNSPWTHNPSTAVRAVLGYWVITALRHLRAIIVLAQEHDLAKVADVHYRQILEIFLQSRAILSAQGQERERLAQKVSAWGCMDYLDKTRRFSDSAFAKKGYLEVEEQLSRYDPALVDEVRSERGKGNMHWFGTSFTRLGSTLSKGPEDLGHAYRIISGQSHGSWDITLDVAHPAPGQLDFRGYPNEAQLLLWAAESVDQAMLLFLKLWNEVAESVGAPLAPPPSNRDPSPFTPIP